MLKLYSISRVNLFAILTAFPDIQLHEAGQLFASGWLTEDDAKKVLDKYPNSVSLMAK